MLVLTGRAVVLTSGGVDSLVCLVLAARECSEVYPLFVDYGHKAARDEFEAASASVSMLYHGLEGLNPIQNIMPLVSLQIGLKSVAYYFPLVGDATASSRFKPSVSPAVLPLRNNLLITSGSLYALNIEARNLWHGASGDDQNAFPDCQPSHLYRIFHAITKEHKSVFEDSWITLQLPLIDVFRSNYAEVFGDWVRLLPSLSCYDPKGGKPCGICEACRSKAPL